MLDENGVNEMNVVKYVWVLSVMWCELDEFDESDFGNFVWWMKLIEWMGMCWMWFGEIEKFFWCDVWWCMEWWMCDDDELKCGMKNRRRGEFYRKRRGIGG